MDGFFGFVKKLVEGFEKEGLDYAFTGALAVSFYGVPRTTTDVDVMVAVSAKNAKTRLASALRLSGIQVDEKRIDDALTSRYKNYFQVQDLALHSRCYSFRLSQKETWNHRRLDPSSSASRRPDTSEVAHD
ncbi:MAG TPA: hypothetical protein VJ507_02160 [Candidatus Bathyarchaeia archaeon]|nr:hypothetical protein [Candidatus Bathyarchaeia archaeon]